MKIDLSPVAPRQRLHKADSPEYGQVLIYIGPDSAGRVKLSTICRVLGVSDETIDPDGTDLSWLPEAAISLTREAGADPGAVVWCPLVRTAEGEALLDLFSAMTLFASACNWVPGLAAKGSDLCAFLSWLSYETRNAIVLMNWDDFNARAMARDCKPTPIFQWVYFLRDPNQRIKIGISANPHQRMKGMRTDNPERLELLGVIPNATEETELAIHQKFAHLRLTGEWFRECEELLTYVAENTEKMSPPAPKRRRKAKV